MKRKVKTVLQITTRVEVLKLVKVKSFTRVRNGKKEKVRSYYRKH